MAALEPSSSAEPRDRWYLVHSHPRQEALATEHLTRQGYRVLLPRLALPRLRRGRWTESVEPLFPRYLFVGLRTGEQDFHPVHSTRGVSRVVRFGPRYAEVPARLVESLAASARPDGTHLLRSPELVAGEHVRIIAGPFRELDAVFQCRQGDDRVRVLLNVLGDRRAVTLEASLVVPAFAGLGQGVSA